MPFLGGTAGVIGLAFAAITGLTAAHVNRQTTLTFQPAGAGAVGIVVFRKLQDDENEAPNNPFMWFRLTPRPIAATSTNFVDKLVLENRPYTYRLAAVDARGNFSSFTDVQITTPQWVSSANMVLWSEDLTKGLWTMDSGVTVAANSNPAVNGHQITFPSADKAFSQSVPVYPLNRSGGGLYTGYMEVKGVAGERISGFMHADPYSSTGAYQLAPTVLTGGWDPIYLPRPAASTADRYVRIGLQTWSVGGVTSTARVVSMRFPRVAAGTVSQAQMLAGYVATQGPGSVRAEPIEFRADVPGYYALMDQGYAGYHRSDDNSVSAIRCHSSVGKTLNLNGAITVSRGAYHVDTASAFPARTISLNCKHFGLHPLADGVGRGMAYHGDFQYRVDIQNSYQEHTGGCYFANLRTNGGTDKVTYLRNKVFDTDGRRATAAGGYIKTPWGAANPAKPVGVTIAWDQRANLQLNNLDGSAYTGAGTEIAYNEFYGRPGFSRVEDTINLSGQRGVLGNPVRVHHNLNWCNWAWDYAWFDDANRLSRAYQLDRCGNPGDIYYDNPGTYGTRYSGSTGMPVDSSAHSADPTVNGKFIEWYSNVNLGQGAVMGLLDGQSVTIEQNHTAASGYLPSGYLGVPVPVVTGRQPGYQATSYFSMFLTVTTAAAVGATSLMVSYRLGNGPLVAGGRINLQTNGSDTPNAAGNTLLGTLAANQASGSTVLNLAQPLTQAVNSGTLIGYTDNYMSNNLLRRNTVETVQGSIGALADNAVTIAEQLFRPAPSGDREWELYGNWQQLMADSGNIIGPAA